MTSTRIPWPRQSPFPLAALLLAGLILCPSVIPAQPADQPLPRERLSLDSGWKFHLGDDWRTGEDLAKAGSSTGPAGRAFNDAAWRPVDLPHDWAIELPFDRRADVSHGFKPVGPGFPTNSIAWYRRTFSLPRQDAGKRLWIQFDGVYRDSRVFLNGFFLGRQESGYTSFRYDITDLANCGGSNTLAVRVDATRFEGWFYEGAGIYRHVWLTETGPLAIAPAGVFVHTRFAAAGPDGPAEICVEIRLANSQDAPAPCTVRCRILDPAAKPVAEASASAAPGAWSQTNLTLSLRLDSPALWSPDSPALYKLVTTIESGGALTDRLETEFGVRTARFDPQQGFLLNGKPYVIQGACNHQDHAGVGAALPDRLQYFRIARLKEMGANAYRTSHNPPTPELLEACDRLGMLVMDENRLLGSDPANLDRLDALVRRDRNHPSVILWSIANEEPEQTTPAAGRVALTMQRLIHRLDPTRQVTMAANVGNAFEGINRIIDVRGWNYYFGRDTDDYHAAHPAQPNVGSEQASTVCTRGIYANAPGLGYVSAYDDNAPPWADTAEHWWKFFAARPWLSGGFAWTGFDYRGEPTPYAWPCISSHFGIFDTCGFPKDNFYYYQSWWGRRPVVHLLPHWTWPGHEGRPVDVRCFSNCQEVELFLNGRSLGRKPMPRYSHLAWKVDYTPGTLLAKGYNAGQAAAQDQVETAGPGAAIKLSADRPALEADGRDVAVVTVAVTDAQGRLIPEAGDLVSFELTGRGRILGVGNGDPACHEPDTIVTRPAPRSVLLDTWRIKEVPDTKDRPETAKDYSVRNWRRVDIRADLGPLAPNRCAVFRRHFEPSPATLSASSVFLVFGAIHDDGWVYLNGRFVGEAHGAPALPSFEIGKFIEPGDNTIAVVVRTHGDLGGLNNDVWLVIQDASAAPNWQRSVFNGLAEVIVQSGKQPGELKLTARAQDLTPATLTLATQPCALPPAVP